MWGIELEAEWWMNSIALLSFPLLHTWRGTDASRAEEVEALSDATLPTSRSEQYIEVAFDIAACLKHCRL